MYTDLFFGGSFYGATFYSAYRSRIALGCGFALFLLWFFGGSSQIGGPSFFQTRKSVEPLRSLGD